MRQTSVEGRAFQYRDSEPAGRESAVRVLFIASADLIAAWSSRVAATRDVLTFTDTDWQNALEAIARRRPQLVVIEQVFATTSRGMTFINGMQTNPNSSGVEIRMLPPERTAALISSQLTVVRAAASLAALAQPFLSRPTRRAFRIKTTENPEARVDGSPVSVVDVSVCGAQVLSVTILRAGIEFSDAAPRMLEALCSRLCREKRRHMRSSRELSPRPPALERERASHVFLDLRDDDGAFLAGGHSLDRGRGGVPAGAGQQLPCAGYHPRRVEVSDLTPVVQHRGSG